MIDNPISRKNFPWVFKTLERDSFKCVDCKYSMRKKLLVHHIDGSRKLGKLNNDLTNLITLCRRCHARHHGITKLRLEIIGMHKNGMTGKKIGKKLKITHQRVYQLLKYYRKHPLAISL